MLVAALAMIVVMAAPSSDSETLELVRRLGSPRYTVREAAERALTDRGRIVLPALQAATSDENPEIRLRAAAIVSKIERIAIVEPTTVAFDLQDQPIAPAVSKINAQAGLRLALAPEDLQAWVGRRVTLKTPEALPFWAAIDAFCRAGRLHYEPGGTGDLDFVFRDGLATETAPVSDSGPFRVELSSIHLASEVQLSRSANDRATPRKQFYIQLNVAAEPRLSVTSTGPATVTLAVDDQGRSMVLPTDRGTTDRSSGYFGINPSPVVRLRVDLAYPDQPGKRIDRIRGTIPVLVATRKHEPLVVPLNRFVGRPFRGEDVAIAVQSVGASNVELIIATAGAKSSDADVSRPEVNARQLEILDGEGHAIPWFLAGSKFNGEHSVVTLTLSPRSTPSTPTSIRYHGLIRASTEIPFEFRDLPMP